MNYPKIYFWAAMHSPDFNLCYMRLPFSFRVSSQSGHWGIDLLLRVHFREFGFYIPYRVVEAYYASHPQFSVYDDIPF